MKINKVSDEMKAPVWAFGSKELEAHAKNEQAMKSVERINAIPASQVNESTLAQECDAIEKCASSKKVYHYNSTWKAQDVSHLKEYASACGLPVDKVQGVDPTDLAEEIKPVQAASQSMVKTASTETKQPTLADKLAKIEFDPFHFGKNTDMSHMEKENWQEVKSASKMAEAPTMRGGAVIPSRGGEDYFKNSEPKTAKNQNSITNPDAIKQLAESTEVDTGARLKTERIAREDAHKAEHKSWQDGIVAAMTHKDIVSHGKVFPTESMTANTGLNNPSSRQMGVYAKFDKDSVPEFTDGEKIKVANEQRKAAIQRPGKEKSEFHVEKAATRGVSDILAEELKKRLSK